MQIEIFIKDSLNVIDYRTLHDMQGNLKTLTEENYQMLKYQLQTKGFRYPFFVWFDKTGKAWTIDGNQRRTVFSRENVTNEKGGYEFPYLDITAKDFAEAKEMLLAYNSHFGQLTQEGLAAFSLDMADDFLNNVNFYGLKVNESLPVVEHGKLSDKFICPPFSVLDTKQGYWLERKRLWGNIIIKQPSNKETIGSVPSNQKELSNSKEYGQRLKGVVKSNINVESSNYQFRSIFDPVLCEVCYKWFCPPGGSVLDPFAGTATAGIVAGVLGLNYYGIELQDEQVKENYEQANKLIADGILKKSPTWINGNSLEVLPKMTEKFDFIFDCPPYHDLEIYSNNPGDISGINSYQEFIKAYGQILHKSIARLNDNRFLCLLVSEIRNERGVYKGFVQDTINILNKAGLKYYNDIILVNAIGSLPIRIGRQFASLRKVGRMHQNVLVFYKGDIKKIPENFPEIQIDQLPEMVEE